MRHLDLTELRRRLGDPWAVEDTGPSGLGPVADELQALANHAYVDNDEPARREAEAILYFINIDNCFAPPLHAAASLAWTTLMRVKLGALRRKFGGCEPIDVPEMSRRLKAAVEQWGAYNHPLLAQFRDHPLMTRRSGFANWPPQWRPVGLNVARVKGEVGILEHARMNDLITNKIFLVIEQDRQRHVAVMAFDDGAFANLVYKLLRLNCGRSVKEIGDLDLSHLL